MASNRGSLEQVLVQAVGPLMGSGSLAGEVDRLTLQLQRLQSVHEAALASERLNTQALQGSTSSQASGNAGKSVASTALSFLGSGLGISPLISGVLKLFGGGGGSSEPVPLPKFVMPSALSVNAGVSSSLPGPFAVDYGQGNGVRPVVQAGPQITVQVSAMDSQSFLDRSNDIALAVRQAMLESSVLNDVVREV